MGLQQSYCALHMFSIRVPSTEDWICPDTPFSWAHLFGEETCRVGSEHRAKLHQFYSIPMIPQPRGHRPRDAVWDQRKASSVDSTGCDYDPSKESCYSRLAHCTPCMLIVLIVLAFSHCTASTHSEPRPCTGEQPLPCELAAPRTARHWHCNCSVVVGDGVGRAAQLGL